MICGDLQHEPRRQSRHVDFAQPGKIGEVALQVRQLQNWANKIAGFRDEWKKEERANQQSGRNAKHSKRCDRPDGKC